MSLLLSQQERDRFAAWLENEAATCEGLIGQMERINTPEVILRRFKAEAGAAQLIARKLRSISEETIRE